MQQVIAVENAGRGEFIDECQRRLRAFNHGECHGAVERHDGRGLDALEQVVEPEDLRPVGILGSVRPGNAGRRLPPAPRTAPARREWPPRTSGKAWAICGVIPEAAILIFEKDKIAG